MVDSVTGSLLGIIPVAIAGGLVMKVTDQMFGQVQQPRRMARRRTLKRPSYNGSRSLGVVRPKVRGPRFKELPLPGDFSNLGW